MTFQATLRETLQATLWVTRWVVCAFALCIMHSASHAQDSTATSVNLTKNPTTAVLLSLPLPGLGQWYNEQYWKIPIFTGTCGFTAYLFFKNNADFNTTDDLYEQAKAEGADPTVTQRLLDQREVYRNNRDLAGVIFLGAYILAAVDAYVGAHLYDFNVDDDLSLGIGPSRSHYAALNLRLRF